MPDVTGVNMDMYRRAGGFQGQGFCGVAHPDNPDPETAPEEVEFFFCRRLPHRDGSDHAAFTFRISVPDRWPDERPTVL